MKRIEYMDCMRGLTMIIVVYSHVIISYCLCLPPCSFLNGVFINFQMPLFFWISGFFAYSILDTEKYQQKVKKRVLGQLIPTIVMMSLFLLWTGKFELQSLLDNYKYGYWYTWVLFFLAVFYLSVNYVCDRMVNERNKSERIKTILYLLITAGVWILFHFNEALANTVWARVLGMKMIAHYAPFFCFGMIAKMYYEKFNAIFRNGYVIGLCIVLYPVFFLVGSALLAFMCGFLAIIVINALFQKYEAVFSSETKIGRALMYIGKRTIQIYFLHYFFFKFLNLSSLGAYLIANNMELVGFVLTFAISIIIVAGCLLLEKMFLVSEPIYSLMFGPVKN